MTAKQLPPGPVRKKPSATLRRLANGDRAPEYDAWCNMRCRCSNPRHRDFPYYGGRGVTVDAAWVSFEQFVADVGKRPTKRHTLERLDNSRGYEPGNVAWRTRVRQQNNRRNNRWLVVGGIRRTLGHWERLTGLPVRQRIIRGWDPERAVTQPLVTLACSEVHRG
jgi:hypothetical protein